MTTHLAGVLSATVVWCDPTISTSLDEPRQRQALAEVGGLQDGVVTVSQERTKAGIFNDDCSLLQLRFP